MNTKKIAKINRAFGESIKSRDKITNPGIKKTVAAMDGQRWCNALEECGVEYSRWSCPHSDFPHKECGDYVECHRCRNIWQWWVGP